MYIGLGPIPPAPPLLPCQQPSQTSWCSSTCTIKVREVFEICTIKGIRVAKLSDVAFEVGMKGTKVQGLIERMVVISKQS